MIEELDESLFADGAGMDLEGADRIAWACVSFWMGRNLDDLKSTLEAWSQDEVPRQRLKTCASWLGRRRICAWRYWPPPLPCGRPFRGCARPLGNHKLQEAQEMGCQAGMWCHARHGVNRHRTESRSPA